MTWNCSRPVTKLSGDVLTTEAPADRSAISSSPSTPSWNSVGRSSGTGINNDAASSGALAERIRRATSTSRRQTAPSRSTAASSEGSGSPAPGSTSPTPKTRDNESSCDETRSETEESTTDARRANRSTSPPTHASTDDSSSWATRSRCRFTNADGGQPYRRRVSTHDVAPLGVSATACRRRDCAGSRSIHCRADPRQPLDQRHQVQEQHQVRAQLRVLGPPGPRKFIAGKLIEHLDQLAPAHPRAQHVVKARLRYRQHDVGLSPDRQDNTRLISTIHSHSD